MRFRFLLILLPVVLGACSKTAAPVRLDFIGTPGLTSGNRAVGPNDTLTTRAYARGTDKALARLRITVTYGPGLSPILYPVPLTNYNPDNGPSKQEIVYLDSLIAPIPEDPTGREYLFQHSYSARSTSGTELWQYTATDNTGQSAARAYRLTARKPDSAAVFHNYTAVLRPRPRTPAASDPLRDRARVFLNLRYGLLLPKYAVLNNEASVQANQQLVDVVCATRGTGISLDALTDSAQLRLLPPAKWPLANRRATQLRRTTLTPENFAGIVSSAPLAAAFNAGTPFSISARSVSTGVLVQNQVVAFRTTEGTTEYSGLLLVSNVVLGTAPALSCSVKVQKL